MFYRLLALLLFSTAAHAQVLEPAPIHGEDVEVSFNWKTPWLKDRITPEVIERTVHVVWDGASRTPKGHPFPALYLRARIALQAGAVLSTSSDKPATPEHLAADDRDVYTFEIPLRKLARNVTPFFVRFARGEVAEFELETTLNLKETVYGLHRSCEDEGVKLTEQSSGTHGLFLFVRCVREDRVLYVNILKPLDRGFVASHTSKQLLETSGQPVLRVAMLPEQVRKAATLAQLRIVDPANKNAVEQYLLTFESRGPSGFRLALGLAPTFVAHSENGTRPGPSNQQLPLTGLLDMGYVFFPGAWEVNLSARGTLVPYMLTNAVDEAARWYGLDYHLGWLIRVGEQEHVLGVHLGWSHLTMQVQSEGYGLGRYGSNALSGPQFMLNMNYRPYGRLGWGAYVKGGLLGQDQFQSIAGVTFDLPWFGKLPRRPAVLLDGNFLSLQLGTNKITETQILLGLMYPIL